MLISFISLILAIWVLVSSITRIADSISLKSHGSSLWDWMPTLVFGILGAVFGIVLLFSRALSGLIASFSIAVILISYGIDNILIFSALKNQRPYPETPKRVNMCRKE